MKEYLVIGIDTIDGIFTLSRNLHHEMKPEDASKNGEIFSDFLEEETKENGSEGSRFEKILVVFNNEVIADLNQGEDFDIEEG